MTVLLSLVLRVARAYPFRFTSLLLVVAASGLLDGLSLAMTVPLLNIVMAGQSTGYGAAGDAISRGFIKVAGALSVPLTLGSVLVFAFLLVVAYSGMRFVGELLIARLHVAFHGDVMKRLDRAYWAASWPFFFRSKTGDLINPVTAEAERAASALQWMMKALADGLIVLIYVGVALVGSWQLTVSALVVAGASFFLLRPIRERAYRYGTATSDANSEIQSQLVDKLGAAKMIKASASESEARAVIEGAMDLGLRARFSTLLNAALAAAVNYPLSIGIVYGILFLALTQLDISFALVVLCLVVFYRLLPRLSSVQLSYQQALAFAPAVQAVDAQAGAAESDAESTGGAPFARLKEAVEFRDVTYRYPGDRSERPALHGVSLHVARGRITAIVGRSGSGKSTLVDLLLGLLEPTSGAVLVDGADLRTIERRSWRQSIGYVAQEPALLNDSLRRNIAWGMPGASAAQVERAAQLAYVEEFVAGLPQRYETVVGDRGVLLSGGQRQRLCLARAVARPVSLLVLDEATSALDAESEQRIYQAVERLRREMTIVLISHRLATVRMADYIYVLDEGRIVEQGAWQELVAADGHFERLRRLQLVE